MLKKLLALFVIITAIFGLSLNKSYAANVSQTIDIVTFDYPHIDFFPRTLHVNQGDTLHLTIRNDRREDVRIFIPAFNLDKVVPKTHVIKIDLCIANPISSVMAFHIDALDGEKIPGYIITNNYKVPMICQTPKVFDTSFLNSIINYNKDFCYPEKAEPKYTEPKPTKEPVRGYW